MDWEKMCLAGRDEAVMSIGINFHNIQKLTYSVFHS